MRRTAEGGGRQRISDGWRRRGRRGTERARAGRRWIRDRNGGGAWGTEAGKQSEEPRAAAASTPPASDRTPPLPSPRPFPLLEPPPEAYDGLAAWVHQEREFSLHSLAS